jgi:hypothetical protein
MVMHSFFISRLLSTNMHRNACASGVAEGSWHFRLPLCRIEKNILRFAIVPVVESCHEIEFLLCAFETFIFVLRIARATSVRH